MVTPVSMKQLLEAGVHFGHQTRRWNPKMRHVIFTERNGIHIIDLQQTVTRLDEAINFVRDAVAGGGEVLVIGTKKQARETVEMEAGRAALPYVNNRWLGGTLTNFRTIKGGLERLRTLERMKEEGTYAQLPKKEVVRLEKERERLEKFLGGLKGMGTLPAAVFVVDPHQEEIAVAEAQKLDIPVVAITDTNCDPDKIDFVIPGNDDAIRAITIITKRVADACIEGRLRRRHEEPAQTGGQGPGGERSRMAEVNVTRYRSGGSERSGAAR